MPGDESRATQPGSTPVIGGQDGYASKNPSMISERRTEILQLVAVLSASLCGGLVFHVLNLPVAWLLGPMFAGSLLAFASSEPKQIPHPARAGAQVVIGVAVGLRLSPEAFWGLGSELPFLLLLVAATGALSMLNGYLLGRFAGVDPATGFLGSIPGAASGMIAISGDLGADPRLVALLQYMRVLLVALLVPFFVQHAAPHLMGAESGTQPSALDSTDGLAATLGDIGTHCLLVAYAVVGLGGRAPASLSLPKFARPACGGCCRHLAPRAVTLPRVALQRRAPRPWSLDRRSV